MAFKIPEGALCYIHEIEGRSRPSEICADSLQESHSPRSVDDFRKYYRERHKNSQEKEAGVTVYFEPLVGKKGTFYFVVVPIPPIQYGRDH